MCYKKPGPRCSKVAMQKLSQAQQEERRLIEQKEDPDTILTATGNRMEAERQFYMTTEGLNRLRQKVAKNEDPQGRYARLLFQATQNRAEALAAARALDFGDVEDMEEGANPKHYLTEKDPVDGDESLDIITTGPSSTELVWNGKGSIFGSKKKLKEIVRSVRNVRLEDEQELGNIWLEKKNNPDKSYDEVVQEMREKKQDELRYEKIPAALVGDATKVAPSMMMSGFNYRDYPPDMRSNILEYRDWVKSTQEKAKGLSTSELRSFIFQEREKAVAEANQWSPGAVKAYIAEQHQSPHLISVFGHGHPSSVARAKVWTIDNFVIEKGQRVMRFNI